MKSNKTSLFLIELMISLLMFSFCAAVCVQLFYAAHVRTAHADELARSVDIVTSVAETYKTSGGSFEPVKRLFPARDAGDFIRISFDENWNRMDLSSSGIEKYYLYAQITGNGEANIGVYRTADETEIFAVTVKAVSVDE